MKSSITAADLFAPLPTIPNQTEPAKEFKITLSPDLAAGLVSRAAAEGMSPEELLTYTIAEYLAEKNGEKPRKTAEKARKKRQEWKRLIFEYYNRERAVLLQPTPYEYPFILAGLIDELAAAQEESGIYWHEIRDDVRRLCMKYCLSDLDDVAILKDDGSTDFYLSDFMADFVAAYNAGYEEIRQREEEAGQRWQKELEERAKLVEEKRKYAEAERERIRSGEAAADQYTAEQAGDILGITAQTVIKRAKAGRYTGTLTPGARGGFRWIFTGHDLAKILNE